jgi:hypothetical protein
MRPEYGPEKDAANIVKHRLSLVEGEGVLNDPPSLTVEDDSSAEVSLDHCREERQRRNLGGSLDTSRRRRAPKFRATSNHEGAEGL